ncbi:hypothetical protein ACEWY4_015495 [Coilia grayii]|uniref:Ig-like domain-containing protein n=1 Tax=Coilia grayii TaxID=363190 RepID=A0ABD1JPS6_9TELE
MLECFFSKGLRTMRFYWFKQTLGGKPLLLVQSQRNAATEFAEGFNDGRFQLDEGEAHFHLNFSRASRYDEGMYFCGVRKSYEVLFANGTFLAVEGNPRSAATTVVQSPISDPIYPGGSVTLQCTVLTEKRSEELRVVWFRRSSGDALPGLIYSPTDTRSQCEDKCAYVLYKTNLTLNDSGMYYCVVDTCGQVIFGNGTMLEIKPLASLNSVVISLGGALLLCIGIIICLIWLNCNGKECRHCKGT